MAQRIACITGASGFLATQIALLLVNRSWKVRACVRSPAKAEAWKAKYPMYTEEQIEFVYVPDMQVDGSFDEAVKGCEVVFHTASPFNFTFKDNEKDMLIPAKQGALTLLRAAKTEPAVKRVIFTSSFAAIVDPHLDPRPGHTYTETDWNPSTWEEAVKSTDPHFVYLASKAHAEKAVWDFVKAENPAFSVTSIIPPVILGEAAQPFTSMADINQSSRVLWRIVDATVMPPTPAYVCVDVKDCALCHVLAAEQDIAVINGKRYLTVGSQFSQTKAAKAIADLFPDIAARLAPGAPHKEHYTYSSALVEKDLGINWRPFELTVKDAFTQLLNAEKNS
ncbi:NAD-P-binding protein [Mycena albidolilacea]|uniref:NAD-P-binding protein n=1 Tax=Mycena albidolilacea TaxID=1033008 RepID=A0AAD7E7Y6_9AGAR|nr:NAD-P-binding protein [Mycena albidolilacea]